jgi:predicted acylesterase/phospholipase RssA
MFFVEKTLSTGKGIESALSGNFHELVNKHLRREGQAELGLTAGAPAREKMTTISRGVFEGKLLRRDLVMTGNCLEQSHDTLPSDLYFYASGQDDSEAPPFGARGIFLGEHPSILMDVVMGSSAIFPLFPPCRIEDFPAEGQHVELVDGGFAHNSPIEAAVLWGATHVILIEATPETLGLRENFAQNAGTAFAHLHRQTQLVDMRSKQQVVVYTLTPEAPHMCVLDFADELIEESMQRGYRDATGSSGDAIDLPAAKQRFRKELGEPVFARIESGE